MHIQAKKDTNYSKKIVFVSDEFWKVLILFQM